MYEKRLFLCFVVFYIATAQAQPTTPLPSKAATNDEKATLLTIPFNPDNQVVTEHTTTIKGQKVPFVATTGTMPVWDEESKRLRVCFIPTTNGRQRPCGASFRIKKSPIS